MRRLVVFSVMVCFCVVASARGGGRARPGGGGGGPGGGFRPSRPAPAPTPRPAPRPGNSARPGTLPAKPGGGVAGRPPTGGGAGPGMVRPRPGTTPARPGGRPGAGDVGRFVGGHPPGHFPGAPGHRPGYTGYHKAEFYGPIHNHFPYHPVYGYPFGHDWCAHFHWHYTRWPYWTAAATGAAVASFVGVSAYSGYGYAEQVPYYPVEPAPATVYQNSVAEPAESVSAGQMAAVSDDADWMNLGTFGIIPYKASDFAYAVQLATTKDGIVRGIQWDMKANTSVEVEGSINKDTLKVAWQAKGAGALMFETNVDELTQQESMVNVYDTQTKALVSWQLIQIDQKDLPPAK